MPAYKLTYFPVKALAEPLRMLISYGGEDFEDYRFNREDWPSIKPTMPFGQVPVLEWDGRKMNQSVALCRYLGKKYNLAGSTDLENLEIDAIVDTVHDFRAKLAAAHYEADEAVKEKKYQQVLADVIPYYLDKLDAVAKSNDGHLALKKLTWADFAWAGMIDYMSAMARLDLLAKHPNLKAVVDNVLVLPKVKEWVAKRPVTEY
ncbi:glutathione S-transferase-like [Ctenocephalides felis]|uniref:glutathione S-transferase-like n=1 Tax=Ctenocephalides felis TaxID=7515 RepID=UPI000E6E2FE7|nr:glutathione S-transferase-like [Ctenocephalides felis]